MTKMSFLKDYLVIDLIKKTLFYIIHIYMYYL